jgi:hypothetical protein
MILCGHVVRKLRNYDLHVVRERSKADGKGRGDIDSLLISYDKIIESF